MIDTSDSTDYQLRHGRNHMTGGGDALWGLDPSEILSRMEEASETDSQREREALREEIFNTLLEYLFADGVEPWMVSARARAYIAGVIDQAEDLQTIKALDLHFQKITREKEDDFWKTAAAVSKALTPYAARFREIRSTLTGNASLSDWFKTLRTEEDRETVQESLRSLALLLVSQGTRPRHITGVVYCLAKTLKPELIASMSLETIAVLSGDKGRATPQARCNRIYTLLLEQAGARATRYHHQKSATTAERCRAAQMGNSNRNKNSNHRTNRNK
jgi:hypothetical protein